MVMILLVGLVMMILSGRSLKKVYVLDDYHNISCSEIVIYDPDKSMVFSMTTFKWYNIIKNPNSNDYLIIK